MAKGEVIIWINSDDELDHKAVENVKAVFTNNSYNGFLELMVISSMVLNFLEFHMYTHLFFLGIILLDMIWGYYNKSRCF